MIQKSNNEKKERVPEIKQAWFQPQAILKALRSVKRGMGMGSPKSCADPYNNKK